MTARKYFTISTLALACLFAAGCAIGEGGMTEVRIGDVIVMAEVADDAAERTQGLSGRERLGQDQGMLFLFEEMQDPAVNSFWMKEMRFPLDMIWIMNGTVVSVSESVPVQDGDDVSRMRSDGPYDAVLEVNAGFVGENGIKSGDSVIY